MEKIKPASYQYYNHFLLHAISMKKQALVKISKNDLTYKHA